MDVFEAVKLRRSIRSYRPKPVPTKSLNKILEAARLAPSAHNSQPWHFIIVTDPEKRKAIAKECMFGRFLSESPVVIVGCGDPSASPGFYVQDTTIALEHMVLVATGEGLGTCWIGAFKENSIKKLLKIPDKLRIVSLLALGFSKESLDLTRALVHAMPPRKKLHEITSFEEYMDKQTFSMSWG